MMSNASAQQQQRGRIRPRVLYSSVFVWISLSGGRFLAPQLQDAGLSDSQIGICLALQTCLSSVCSALSGALADGLEHRHPGRGRLWVLTSGIAVCTVAFCMQGLATTLPLLVGLRCIYAAASSFIFPVLDGLTLDFLDHDKADFGKERLFGAISWAITNLIMGPSLDYWGFSVLYPYCLAAAMAVFVTIVLYARDQTQQQQQHYEVLATIEGDGKFPRDQAPCEPRLERRKSHLVQEESIALPCCKIITMIWGTTIGTAFVVALFTLSIGTVVVEDLIFLYFEILGSSYTLCAMTVLLTVLFEIPIFQVAPQLLEKYGTTKLLLMACFCYMTRVVGYSLVPMGQPWWVLLLEPLHGVTYACSAMSAVEFVAQLVPQGYDASGQGMLYTLQGTGNVIGLLLGGIGEDMLGPRTMYRLLAAIVTVGFTVLSLAVYQNNRNQIRVDAATDKVASETELELVDHPVGDEKAANGDD